MWCCDKRKELYDGFIKDCEQPFLFGDVDEEEYFCGLVHKSHVCPSCRFWLCTRYVVLRKKELRSRK